MYFSFPKQKEKYQKKVLFVPRMIQSLNQHAAARVLARRVANSFEIIIQHDLVDRLKGADTMSKVYQATHVGKVRKNNEDAIIYIEPEIFAVADGMGGQAAGEVASNMLIDTIKNFLPTIPEPLNEDILQKAILKANAAILREAEKNPQYQGMGTTATILHIYNRRAYFAHVGDSRLYRLRNKNFEQITQDHSYVEELVRAGEITEAEARVHPMKNVLTQAVGVVEKISVDTANFPVENGDIFLLCTDGLTNMVDDKTISEILSSSENPAEILIKTALDNGGTDNVSVIVVGVDK